MQEIQKAPPLAELRKDERFRRLEAAQLEQAVRQARAGRGNEDPRQWTVDFRELRSK